MTNAALDKASHGLRLNPHVAALPSYHAGMNVEVAAVVRLCRQHGVPIVTIVTIVPIVTIVTQSGRTGLVGGAISHPGEVIVALTRMQQVIAAVGLEPGVDTPSRGSATLAGMVSAPRA